MKTKFSNVSEICSEELWNNALTLSNSESFYNKYFVDKNIVTIKNIIDESGEPQWWTKARNMT